ncbi:ubiquitin carboxyl-terminal hydrolase 2-like isoform X2 [Pecten maximus]|uniref:ubiquitin carboxyl-terminal hydrolase 2-like isoform X2 n=1 Tax=Pecten maximus TaxID=6579 RepID=UPI0014589400|nr:ubiquitin carboxyl-terminal hydrolase 2-like isoform X2 [Pecten maximus]
MTSLRMYVPSSWSGRMPSLTGTSRTSDYNSGYTPSTKTTYHASSTLSRPTRASSLPRSPSFVTPSTTRTRAGYSGSSSGSTRPTSRSNITTKVSSRTLPPGPGPLDSSGKKLSNYSVNGPSSTRDFKTRSNTSSSSIGGNGPLKADHNSTTYTSTYGYGSTSTSTLPRGDRPTSGLKGRRSSSIASLSEKASSLRIEDDLTSYTPRSRVSDTQDLSSSRTSKRDQYELDNREHRRNSRTASVEPKETSSTSDFFSKNFTSSNSRLSSPSHEKESSLPPSGRKYENGLDLLSKAGRSSSNSYTSTAVSSRYMHAGKTGLRNLGNTCFMSSVLQCLSNTKPLIEFCLNEEYLSEKNTTTSSMKGQLMTAYASLMMSMWKDNDASHLSPSAFKMQVQKFAPRFTGYAQQDAQEFLRYLLEGLHEDVNRVRSKPKPVTIKDEDFTNDSEKAEEYYRVYLSYGNSRIVEIFVGQLKSELRFKDCGHKSTTFDPFWDLSVPIPKRGSQVSIQQCINLFMKEEELDHDERPTCEQCKKRKACTKSFSIQRFPQILVLHLKRFSQGRYSQKVSSCVDFPSTLDMTDYASEKGTQRVVYNLYAVSNHIGSVYSGHYTAYCKHPYSGEWNSFNDTRVSSTTSSSVISPEAYVLFYELSSQRSARL